MSPVFCRHVREQRSDEGWIDIGSADALAAQAVQRHKAGHLEIALTFPDAYSIASSALDARLLMRYFNVTNPTAFTETPEGASLIRSCARAVLGKAMTSRSDSDPDISITIRSTPRAMPPWGGAP